MIRVGLAGGGGEMESWASHFFRWVSTGNWSIRLSWSLGLEDVCIMYM